jgi:hypothetical protein
VRTPNPKQRWLTFVHNHTKVIVACDFLVVMTATFRILYVFVLMEVGTRRFLNQNVTAHPTAEWTLQQVRETLPGNRPYRFLLHDQDSIFSQELDRAVTRLGVRVLRTPVRAPKASRYCERLGGSLRRKCLDFLIPLSEGRLRGGGVRHRARPPRFPGDSRDARRNIDHRLGGRRQSGLDEGPRHLRIRGNH